MTARYPIVNVNGALSELPAGDSVSDPVLAAVSQLCGYTSANIAEVEASTKAARITFERQSQAGYDDRCFSISHHSLGIHASNSAGAAWTANSELITAGLINTSTLVLLRRIDISAGTSALTGGAVGTARVSLVSYDPLVAMGSTGAWVIPGTTIIESGVSNGGPLYNSLRGAQDRPRLIVQTIGLGANPALTTANVVMTTSKTLGEILGSAKGALGPNIPPCTMFYHGLQNHPLIFEPNTGFGLVTNWPAPGSSTQTVHFSVNLQWTEWQQRPPF